MDPIPAQETVNLVHTLGIEAAVSRLRMIASNQGKDSSPKEALYQVIVAAQKADCPVLAATACVMYETQN